MSYHKIFEKSYDDESGSYHYICNGVECYSSENLSEDQVRSNLEVLY